MTPCPTSPAGSIRDRFSVIRKAIVRVKLPNMPLIKRVSPMPLRRSSNPSSKAAVFGAKPSLVKICLRPSSVRKSCRAILTMAENRSARMLVRTGPSGFHGNRDARLFCQNRSIVSLVFSNSAQCRTFRFNGTMSRSMNNGVSIRIRLAEPFCCSSRSTRA
ncbi:hypothetical protein D3C77_456630 [compost metagenome]